jgi:hypothetical protein
MGLFCQLADLNRELSLSDHRADFLNVHFKFLLYNKKPEATAPGSLYTGLNLSKRLKHCSALFANSKLTDHVSVAFNTVPSQIIEQATALAHDFQKPPAGAMVFLVSLEMLCEVRDAFAKNGNLDFRRTRIRGVNTMRRDNRSLAIFR